MQQESLAMRPAALRITKSHYELLASLRHALRRFLTLSQEAARSGGLTPQQHQALLAIKGFPGRDHVSVGELAGMLQLRHHSAVGLVDRLAARRLIRRTLSSEDRRCVEVRLTPRGERLIARLSEAHLRELRQLGPELHALIGSVTGAGKTRRSRVKSPRRSDPAGPSRM
jgi:DNA-binding MarR family transcriptional regulator